MKNSTIQWTDHTFNPWEGCAKVAPECKNCYAETLVDHRFHRVKWGKGRPRRRTSEQLWKQPLRWNADAKNWSTCVWCGRTGSNEIGRCDNCSRADLFEPRRPRVFCLSLGDWLDDEVPIEWLADLLKRIHATPNLDWQLLTKRPQNWRDRIESVIEQTAIEPWEWLRTWVERNSPPSNIWIGVSAGADQKAALDIPAKVHFLSCEPMLHGLDTTHAAEFDWIIFGGESGNDARRMNIFWIQEGLRFCRQHSIAPFVKQLGAKPYQVARVTEIPMMLRDSHGGDMSEWPEDLRIREFPVPRF